MSYSKSSSYLWTSESVSPGHPDKIADQISDTVLDAYLAVDQHAKVACETMVKDSTVIIAGEISSSVPVPQEDIEALVRSCIVRIGYDHDDLKYNGANCEIQFRLSEQSREINTAVLGGGGHDAESIAAGDQGIMFGYATRETPTAMPLALYLAKEIVTEAYENTRTEYALRPDMKSQVSLKYEDGIPVAVDNIVLSACHAPSLSLNDVRELVTGVVLPRVIERQPDHIRSLFTPQTKHFVNPAGSWNIGGPVADCGLTGRKIVVDQYGADCEVGGGAFSGKDPSKVDRSAAYMARYIALRALEKTNADVIKVQLAYVIGVEYPSSIRIWNPRTAEEYPLSLLGLKAENCAVSSIVDLLKLRKPIYAHTARYGHFGLAPFTANNNDYYTWENRSTKEN